jgi:phage shock protein C
MTEQAPFSAPTMSSQDRPAPRRLVRSRNDRWLSGVCGGIAEYTGLDADLVRLIVVLGTVLGFGSLLVAYVVAWVLVPSA